METQFDLVIIGAGVVGCAAARELSRYQLKIAVLEKNPDIGMETSAHNSAVLHAGYNNKPGSLMAKFCVEGNKTFDAVAAELDIPYKRTGKLVVGFSEEDKEKLENMRKTGEINGIEGMKVVDEAFIKEKAPHVAGKYALWSPTTAILSPFQFVFGLAENAAKNGVQFFLNQEVTGIKRLLSPEALKKTEGHTTKTSDGPVYEIQTTADTFTTRWVVNCSGLSSDKISSMLGINDYELHPCRGEYFILDKNIGDKLPLPAYPVPDYKTGGLGIHLTPTLDGNIMVGPSTEYIDERDNYACTQKIMDLLISDGGRIFPYLKKEYFIRNFSGIRPKRAPKGIGGFYDFIIERRDDIAPFAVNLVGIESPGLTCAVPISKEIVRLIEEVEPLAPNPDFDPIRRRFPTFHDKSPEEQAKLIAENPDYGEVICRCETITKAEVLDAIRRPLGASTVAGVKYRCRAMMGRCQGGYCQTRISEILMEELSLSPEELAYNRKGSNLFTGEVRQS